MPNLLSKTPSLHHDYLSKFSRYDGEVVNTLKGTCCVSSLPKKAVVPVTRRSHLTDLDQHVLCSIIGTCLTTTELRKLVIRHADQLDRKLASDLQIHHIAVELSVRGGVAAKDIHKALDNRHSLMIKKFHIASDDDALNLLWKDALASGDIPGAYWALMTHPSATYEIRSLAFGDVHMLSHLVGASNRADIRRLVTLEQECAKLKEIISLQQVRLQETIIRNDRKLASQEIQIQQLQTQLDEQLLIAPEHLLEEIAQLRMVHTDREQKLALYTVRRNEIEQKFSLLEAHHRELNRSLQQVRDEALASHLELQALEQVLIDLLSAEHDGTALPTLRGKCILYVGGKPRTVAVLAKLVGAAEGELLAHDGGIEDRMGLLASLISRADFVVFPVDFISHNAMQMTKQTCARIGIAFYPLRSASIASFIEAAYRFIQEKDTHNNWR